MANSKNQDEYTLSIASVSQKVQVPIEVAFEYIVPIPLSLIFKGNQSVPAIVKTDEQAKWITPGLSRTVTWADGNTAQETLLTVETPRTFSYRIQNFTSNLKNLIDKIQGEWIFTETEDGGVQIDWKYVMYPFNDEAKNTIDENVLGGFQSVLEDAIAIIKANLESGKIDY
ncbi:MAG: MxaD family protein [Flavobacterium psychrophilum]|nr:MAG: MxaD family protein [Flavobacterium psychrophilum]